MDLFDIRYPDIAGHKAAGTSQEAAQKIEGSGRAAILRARVLTRYRAVAPHGLTADEVATALNETVLSIRPRVSELYRNGYLEKVQGPNGRRLNDSGMSATVWRFVIEPCPKAAA